MKKAQMEKKITSTTALTFLDWRCFSRLVGMIFESKQYRIYPKHAPPVFVIRSFISDEPQPNIWKNSTARERSKPVNATILILWYFLYNSGKKNPNGTNRITFRMVSIGPVIILIKGVQEIFGLKFIVLVKPMPVTVSRPNR